MFRPLSVVSPARQWLCPECLSFGYTIAFIFSPSDFGPSTQTVKAYDGTQRTVMGTLTAHVMIGPVRYSVLFKVLRI